MEKKILFIIIIIFIFLINKKISKDYLELNINYNKIQKNLNLKFDNTIKKKLRIGIYTYCLKNGGLQRLTSLMLKYFNKIKIFDIYLFTQKKKEDNEYKVPENVKREVIKNRLINNLINKIYKKKIDILIYNFYFVKEIDILNSLNDIKIIFYQHQSFLYWVYFNLFSFKSLYKAYQNSKYVISLIPFENDYLFRKWGIRSILMYNFITYEYDNIVPSDLSSKTILMIGRGEDKFKRFELGIEAMKYIRNEISQCELKIISDVNKIQNLINLTESLKLEKNVKFVGYSSKPEIYFKNASLHIFPTITESFGYVLSETKIYGIPTILIGLDYLSISKGGTIILYDDNPKIIAKEALKIMVNSKYRKKLGLEARNSMKKFKNEFLLKRWVKLLLSIYNGDEYYEKLRKEDKKISKSEALNIIKTQIKLIKIRKNNFKNIKLKQIENFTYIENYIGNIT